MSIMTAAEYEGDLWNGREGFYVVNRVGVGLARYDTLAAAQAHRE